jgi:membrane protein YdbS with pleckstrin-like domain
MAVHEQPAEPPLDDTAPDAPPSIADGVERSLDPRSVALDQAVGWIFTGSLSSGLLVVLVIVSFAAYVPGRPMLFLTLLWAAGSLGLAWWTYRWPEVEYRHASYKVDERGIEIRRGVFWRRVISVPRSRVQHTDVSQGPMERGRGLGALVIYTAGTDYARVELGGLDYATALRIRDHLLAGGGGDAV